MAKGAGGKKAASKCQVCGTRKCDPGAHTKPCDELGGEHTPDCARRPLDRV